MRYWVTIWSSSSVISSGFSIPLASAATSSAVMARSSSEARPAYCGSNRSFHEVGGVVMTSALYMMPAVPASTGTM